VKWCRKERCCRTGCVCVRGGVEVENDYFTEMCSGSETGSYLRLTDFVDHSTLGSETGSYSRLTDFVYHSTLACITQR